MSERSLINSQNCKKLALRIAADLRPGWGPERVSGQFLDDLNIKVRNLITSAVMKHPTRGKTVRWF